MKKKKRTTKYFKKMEVHKKKENTTNIVFAGFCVSHKKKVSYLRHTYQTQNEV